MEATRSEVQVKEKKSAVDASKELIIDSIVLTTDVLHSIRNNLPVPLENVVLQPVDSTKEFETRERPEPDMKILLMTALLALATVIIVSL